METYSRAQIGKVLGVKPRKIEGWVARDVLKPEGVGEGTGNPYRFTFAEMVRAAIIHHTQEDLGSQFVRPGLLSKLLHEQLPDKTISQERRRIEEVISEERRRRKGYIPTIKPDDLILHLHRDIVQKADGGWEGIDWRIKAMRRNGEHFIPRSFVHLSISLALIIRSILIRIGRAGFQGE